jgi:hypothetical protein
MASVAINDRDWRDTREAADQRGAPRFIALIRAAKLICDGHEFVCVVRDVSTTGVRLRCFHPIPRGAAIALELQNGDILPLGRVREEEYEASFRFLGEVSIERLLQETASYPRRPLRLNMRIPLTLRTMAGPLAAVTQNISQQGCRVECAIPLALSQSVVVQSTLLPGIRAKVRWRRGNACGLVFDDTLSLKDFAVHAARVQCPTPGLR